MVKISVEALRSLMDNPNNIRNFSVVAHVDHGKSTLTDSLLYSNEIISKEDVGVKRATDTRPDEALKGITIKSTGVSLHYELPSHIANQYGASLTSKGRQFLINLIDSPGHVDFSSEVTAALRLTDGALVLVDCVEGCSVQTETVLRQALAERIKPVLAINKLDRAFLELQLKPEEMYQSFCRSIESVNAVISTYQDEVMGELEVYPNKETVCFSAGRQGWAFSLRTFARMYAKKLGVDELHLVEKFWGDNYYDPELKKWTTKSTTESGKPISRGFCKFILEPIEKVFQACMSGEGLEPLLKKMELVLTTDEKKHPPGKDLLKVVMQKWLPASEALLEMIVVQLPSPVQAQKYRAELLYTGPQDDETAQSIRACDPNGPLIMYISKMIPSKDNTRFLAFGRVFSGTVSCQKVRVMGANFVFGKKDDLAVNHPIQRVVIMMGGKTEAVDSVPCGNTCALMGVDVVLAKSGTVATREDSWPLANMKYSVSAVVRVAVTCKNPADLPKLVEGLRRFAKSDPLVQVIIEATGEHIIACAGDLHLEISLNDLREFCKCELVVSRPVVPFMETVTETSMNCLSKSPNGHNRLFGTAQPLGDDLLRSIENKEFNLKADPKERATKLVNDYNWDPNDARKIWAFGPEANPLNVLVDMTRGVQYMNEIKDTVVSGFHYVTTKGVLAEEPLKGVRFNLVDALIHADAIHRGAGQIIPSAQRFMCASQLLGKPRFMEPIYLVDIQCTSNSVGGVYSALETRKGSVIECVPRIGTTLYMIKAFLPVAQSFGFTALLREQTSGQAFPQLVFDHWKLVDEDPLAIGSRGQTIAREIRERKGIDPSIPPLDRYLDKF